MANRILTASVIAKEALRVLTNELRFAKGMNKKYSKNFDNKDHKAGDTVNIEKPARYVVRKGRVMQVQDLVQQTIPLTLTDQAGVDLSFTSADLALRITQFSEKIIQPAVAAIANQVDFEALQQYQKVYNTVGTPGTTPATARVYLEAGKVLDDEACPRDQFRDIVYNPSAQMEIVDALKGLFQSSEKIAEQYERGMMGRGLGFDFFMTQNINTHQVGPLGGTPVVAGANQVGFSLATSGWTAAAASRLKKGDVFTIAGVFAVNPQSRQNTGRLRQFVVTADVSSDGAGLATIPISPAIIPVGMVGTSSLLQPNNPAISGNPGFGPDALVNLAAFATVTASPANGAAITVLGAANTLTPQNIAYHRDAFVMGSVELPLPKGVDFAARESSSDLGLTMRIVRAYDINNDLFPCRLDILYGFQTVYPELAVRIAG